MKVINDFMQSVLLNTLVSVQLCVPAAIKLQGQRGMENGYECRCTPIWSTISRSYS
jgi:hypothetical protein